MVTPIDLGKRQEAKMKTQNDIGFRVEQDPGYQYQCLPALAPSCDLDISWVIRMSL